MSRAILETIEELSREYLETKNQLEKSVGHEVIVTEDRKLKTRLTQDEERMLYSLFPIAEGLAINISQLATMPLDDKDECCRAAKRILELVQGKTHFYNCIEKIHEISINCL
jgi:hypothetical protein